MSQALNAPASIALAGLSTEQRIAVERSGQDVCVVAGPGSGKTRVLTERFAWLVETREIKPARILAITFTDKAAIEIKRRLVARFAEQPELRESIERAWVSTIDGFCTRILREHAIAAGLSPEFNILDAASAAQLQRSAAEEALDQLLQEKPKEFRRLLEALDLSTQDNGRQPDLCASLLEVYETMRTSGGMQLLPAATSEDEWPTVRVLLGQILGDATACNTPNQRAVLDRAREWAQAMLALPTDLPTSRHFHFTDIARGINAGHLPKSPSREAFKTFKDSQLKPLEAQWISFWYADVHNLLNEALQRIDTTYRARKRQLSLLDFGDLGEFTIELLESNEAIRAEVADRFDQVLMDELQDTNRTQWRLLKLLCNTEGKLYAVGDINQSIYGFRHADPEVFAEYRDQIRNAGGVIDELADNYRSRTEILRVISDMLNGQTGIEPRELQGRGTFHEAAGPFVERLVGRLPDAGAANDEDTAQAFEASLVAARIREWSDVGQYAFRDMAVLFRTFSAAAAFEQAFDRAGIPYLISGGRGFLEARETKDILSLLAALVNPLDEIPLYGVLRGPLVNLSDEDLFRMDREGWQREFEARFGAVRKSAGFVAPDRLIAMALDQCGYTATLASAAKTTGGRGLANVDKLLAWIRRETYKRPRPLAELLADLETLRSSESIAEAPPAEAGNVVRMMTIHAAKGLEFPVVFLVALNKGPDRRSPIIAISREHGLGAKWRHPITGDGISDSAHRLLSQEEKRREEAEANRLFYVATTRAMQHLVLSYSELKTASAWQKLASAHVPDVTEAESIVEIAPARLREEPTDRPGIVALDPPAVTGQHDASAPVTSIAMFAACPRRYYLERYLGLEEAVPPKTTNNFDPPADLSAAHNASRAGGVSLGLEVHQLLSGEPLEREPSSDATALVQKCQRSDIGQQMAQASRVEREFDFLFEVDGVILRGQIDAWFEDEQGLTLVDYKTDRDESQADAYALQLRLYALALERYVGRMPDRALLVYMRSGNQVEVSLTSADLAHAAETVAAYRDAQEKQNFPTVPGAHCQRCPWYAGACPVGHAAAAS